MNYILQIDFPIQGYSSRYIPKGTVFKKDILNYYVGATGDVFVDSVVENNPDWFKPECSVSTKDGVLYGASKTQIDKDKECVDVTLFDIFVLTNGEFIPARTDQSPISEYNFIWKLDDKKEQEYKKPEAVRFYNWVDGMTIKGREEGKYFLINELNQYCQSQYTINELYLMFKEEEK